MTRKRWVYVDGIAYDADGFIPQSEPAAPQIMPDIAPYKSMITGEVITSRSVHREHLKRHDCIEVGNETDHMVKNRIRPSAPPGLKEDMMRAAYKHGIFKP